MVVLLLLIYTIVKLRVLGKTTDNIVFKNLNSTTIPVEGLLRYNYLVSVNK